MNEDGPDGLWQAYTDVIKPALIQKGTQSSIVL
jgi:hypothetical protein